MKVLNRTAKMQMAHSAGLLGFATLSVVGHLASSAVTIRTTSWKSCEPGLVRWSVAVPNLLEALLPWKEQP